jgi:hypothetical protein
MKKIILLISLSILFVALVTPSYSSDSKQKPDYRGHFDDMDIDGDDQVNWKEFKKSFSHAKKQIFKKVDGNNDGLIDHDEWHEFKEANGYGCKE